MKVLLIQPRVQDFYDTDVRLQPFVLAHNVRQDLTMEDGTAPCVL